MGCSDLTTSQSSFFTSVPIQTITSPKHVLSIRTPLISTATSNPATFPSVNPHLQLEPIFMSSEPGNNRRHPLNTATEPSNTRVIAIRQNVYERVTFWQVLRYWWTYLRQINHHQNNNNSTTPPQLWFVQNVHPLVTPMRIFWFLTGLVSFLIAYRLFMETDFYKSATSHGGQARLLLFSLEPAGIIWLMCLFFFSCCSAALEKYTHHCLVKSIVEFMVKLLVSLVIRLVIEHKSHEAVGDVVGAPGSAYDGNLRFSEVAGLLTCGFLTVVALCVINLLKPGHHYSVFEATATLTLHFGLEASFYLSTPAVCLFIFGITVIKNFLWRNEGRVEEATVNEQHHLAWVALEVV